MFYSSRCRQKQRSIVLSSQDADEKFEFRFDVRKIHAAGGLGEVFIATDRESDRKVAFKRIRDEWVDDEIARQRFYLKSYVTDKPSTRGSCPFIAPENLRTGSLLCDAIFVEKEMKDRTMELF